MRASNHVAHFPPIRRPRNIPATDDLRRLSLAGQAGAELDPLIPPQWIGPYSPREARRRLLAWTHALGCLVAESSGQALHEQVLGNAEPAILLGMNRWLTGHWSSYDALIEACWRAEVGGRVASAVHWLYCTGSAPEAAP
jgi:hypothetical protein